MANTIFVIGMDAFNRRKLDLIEAESDFVFRGLFSLEYLWDRLRGDVGDLLDEAKRELDDFVGRDGNHLDGIIAYWDFPVQTMLPILRSRFGLPGPSLESVLKCEHKYWSRHEQQRVIPDHVPAFQWFDPFESPAARISLDFPFWIKPIKATNSQLGFLIRDEDDLGPALDKIQKKIGRFGHWFDQFLERAELPAEIREVNGSHCMAEEFLQGTQHTLSGWVSDRCIRTHGVVDSHNDAEYSSFLRYQYPSALPTAIQERMAGIGALLIESLGFEHEAFTIEFFYDPATQRLTVLEVNPRICPSHGDLFEKVDGSPNHRIAADLAIGRIPEFPFRKGPFACAGKFYLRTFEDATVASAPQEDDVRRVLDEIDGALVDIRVGVGDRLSNILDRDGYSFELAHIYLGADTENALLAKYERCVEMLDFELTPA